MDAVTGIGGFVDQPVTGSKSPTAEAIISLRTRSGLSWSQVARLFGVSRRSVHNWANGDTLNAENADLLAQFVLAIDAIPGEPAEVRAALLAPDDHGTTMFQSLMRHAAPTPSNPEGFTVDQLSGSQREGDVTHFGELLDVVDADPASSDA